MLSVNHLAMLAKTACSLSGVLDWVDQSLADVEEHLKVYALCLADHSLYAIASLPARLVGLHAYCTLCVKKHT